MKESRQEKTSSLVRGLQLAASRQSEKNFRGSSKDKSVSAKVSGRHELVELTIDPDVLSIPAEQAEELSLAVTEAVNRALGNSQAAARRALEEGIES